MKKGTSARCDVACQIALVVSAFIGAFAVGWMLLDRYWLT
jgi:DNA-binding transcriptional regulator of glucitol operon